MDFGGEPLMNFDVVRQLVAYGEQEKKSGKHFKFTITANGVGPTEEIMAFLNQEMENVGISIDGRREVHDRMRLTPNGKGSLATSQLTKAKKFRHLRQQQQYYIRGTYTR